MSKKPLKLSICSWATGIGGGVARMESYYLKLFDRELFDLSLISLVPRDKSEIPFLDDTKFHVLPENNKFVHLARLIETSDIVQFQGSFDPLVCEAAKLVNTPLLVEVLHNIETGGLFENIDLSICVSNAVKEVQNSNEKAITIHNGVDLNEFRFKNERKRNPETKNKILFLQVGNRSKLSHHLDEIAPYLLDKYNNLEFWIAGREQDKTSSENIKFFGVIKDIESLYQAADYNILFSSNESFGLSIVEGMACGCIPIVSASGGFLDIVHNSHDGFLIENPDTQKIISFLEYIIQNHNSDSSKIMRHNCRKKIESKFSIEKSIRNYQNTYINYFKDKQPEEKFINIDTNEIKPSGDAIIGECIYNVQKENKDLAFINLEFLINENLLVRNPVSISIACNLAQLAFLNKRTTLAESLFSHLILQNINYKRQILEKWFSLIDCKDCTESQILKFGDAIIQHAPDESTLLLEVVEKLLLKNKPELSIKLLEQAIKSENIPHESKSKYIYWLDAIKNKLPV